MLGGATLAAAPASADRDRPPEDRWAFAVAPYLWAISIDGNATVTGVEADVDVPFSDAVQDLSFGAMLLVDARRFRFGIAVNGLFTRVSPHEQVGPIEIDATTDLVQLGMAPTIARSNGNTPILLGKPMRLMIEPWGGPATIISGSSSSLRGSRFQT